MASRLGASFDKLFFAAGISNLGDGIMSASFPLLVASLTRDPLLVSGAALAGRLPWFLFALVSGALVDRMDRKRVMVITDGLRAVGIGILAWGIATGEAGLIVIYIVAFGLGVAETFFDTSAEALTPKLVVSDDLASANGRLQGLEWVGGSFVGPPVGAAVFAVVAAAPFALNAVSFGVAAALIALIPGRYRSAPVSRGIGASIAEGLRWLWGQRVVRTLAFMAGTTNFFTQAVVAVFVLFAQDILGVPDAWYGVLLASLGVGGLIGAVVGPRMVKAWGPGTTLRISIAGEVVSVGFFVFVSNPWPAGALMALYGFQVTAWNVVSVSLRQHLTPDEMRGRVAGASRLLAWGPQPLGALAGGLIASWLGLRAPFLVGGLAFALMLALTWQVTSNRSIEATRVAQA